MFVGDFDYFKQIAQVNWYMDTPGKLVLRTKWRFCYVTPYGRSKMLLPDEKNSIWEGQVRWNKGFPDSSIDAHGRRNEGNYFFYGIRLSFR